MQTSVGRRGYSLIEMLVALAITAAVTEVSLVSFQEFQSSFRRSDARYQLDADLRRVRNEALAAGGRAVLIVSVDRTNYSVGIDYAPFSEAGAPDKNVFTRWLPQGVTLIAGSQVIFDARGYLVDLSGNVTWLPLVLAADGINYYSATLYSTGALS